MKNILLTVILVIYALTVKAQTENKLVIEADSGKYKISKYIYGHFAEHLGRCIYDGIWVGPDSDIPNINGYRQDVLEALQKLNIPVLRWPGGCFADIYHWKDGIGPVKDRPKIKNVFWGGVIEDNSFGTHEFLNLCEMLGCDAYISANVGSGTVEEMVEWIEYMTSAEDIPMANLRKKNGRENPWDVKFLGIGNESWGCGGNMTSEHYADLMKTYSNYAHEYGSRKLTRIACGANGGNSEWTRVLMQKGVRNMDALSLHYYTIAGEGWHNKSSATGFDESLYFSGINKALRMEEIVSRHSSIMDEYDPEKKIGLMVDEWGIWTDAEPGTNPAFLFQQNSMRDALIAALTLDIFNKHCSRVKMANIAQIVNVLQSVILTEKDKMLLTPTYHVFNIYKIHKDATLLPQMLTCEKYIFDGKEMPAVSASASMDNNNKIHITASNVNPVKQITLSIELKGKKFKKVNYASILTAPEINSCNTFDNPENVVPVSFNKYKIISEESLEIALPSKSLLVLELE